MNTSKTFCNVMRNKKNTVILWLCSKYKSLPIEDAEDIVQDSSIDLWQWCNKKGFDNLTENDYVALWKRFCRNKTSRWYKKVSCDSALDETKLRTLPADSDEGITIMRRELMYDCLENMNPKEQTLINMVLENKEAIEICSVLGFKNKTVLKNIKCRTIQKMKREVMHRIAS